MFVKEKGAVSSYFALVDVLTLLVQTRMSYSELSYPCLLCTH
jgi:hypothetical protein